jgi:hypothetical protein
MADLGVLCLASISSTRAVLLRSSPITPENDFRIGFAVFCQAARYCADAPDNWRNVAITLINPGRGRPVLNLRHGLLFAN